MSSTIERVFGLSPSVRYVAVYRGGELAMASRPDLAGASSSESDKYEELVVNPTLLKLLTQRGNLDCGGLSYVLIRYGSFFALVTPLREGHVTLGLEPDTDPLPLVPRLAPIIAGL